MLTLPNLFVQVPETKGKTLEEIQKDFNQDFDTPDFLVSVAYDEEESGHESSHSSASHTGPAQDKYPRTNYGAAMDPVAESKDGVTGTP